MHVLNPLFREMCVLDELPVLQAINRLESSRIQIAFVIDKADRLVGVVTNGDVRRFLLEGGQPGERVTRCMNRTFRSAPDAASREELLKMLDLGYNAIPRIDGTGRLVDVITPEHLPTAPEAAVLTRSRAPVRVSFGGGGSDLTYFFVDHPGAVLSTTISLFSHVTLMPRLDREIHLHSEDLNVDHRYECLEDLQARMESNSLLAATISVIRPASGLELYVRSDFPVGSGLGGSSAVTTAIVAAFNELRLDRWTTYEIAEVCFQAERLCFGVAGGWQDQYASAFGGFNLIEFDGSRNLVHPIRLEESIVNELEECLILCDTQIPHESGRIHTEQRSEFDNGKKAGELKDVVDLCRKMHRHLIRGELVEFGHDLHAAWQLKRGFTTSVTNARVDEIYASAITAGALGGKLLGAGAGGFFLFFVQPRFRKSVTETLKKAGCKISAFRFEARGVISWRTKLT
jgi:D-glycero-alpha-D-manno-heptose-7-phosphate kinase